MKSKSHLTSKKRRSVQKDKDPVIYCLEGIWRDDQTDRRSQDSSVEPLLQYLKLNGYWDYRHRSVSTITELRYFLDNEWVLCTEGSILYLPSHGRPGCISLGTGQDVQMTSNLDQSCDISDDNGNDLVSLLSSVSQEHCHIHFCGCAVLDGSYDWIDEFIKQTNFSVVSGYVNDNLGWTDVELPAVLADVMLFSHLSEVDYSDGRKFEPKLRKVQDFMDLRFKDCGFFYRSRKKS